MQAMPGELTCKITTGSSIERRPATDLKLVIGLVQPIVSALSCLQESNWPQSPTRKALLRLESFFRSWTVYDQGLLDLAANIDTRPPLTHIALAITSVALYPKAGLYMQG